MPPRHGRAAAAETRKSLFEEIGLLYVPHRSGRIVLTELGRQFYDVARDGNASHSARKIKQATTLLAFALSKCQVNRPQSHGSPSLDVAGRVACEIRPYAVLWQAFCDLDGYVSLDEFRGPLRRIWTVAGYDEALDGIRAARSGKKALAAAEKLGGNAEMNYRIYWSSHMSLGDTVLAYDRKSGVFSIMPDLWPAVAAVLQFQAGCDGSRANLMAARPWSSVDDYYADAGAACPPYLASGSPRIVDFDGQSVADLASFSLEAAGSVAYVTGAPALCRLPLLLQCFHPDRPANLLRIDAKEQHPDGSIRLKLGAGRPISNLALLTQTLGRSQ